MSPSATLAELVQAENAALDAHDWLRVHLLQAWRVEHEASGAVLKRCLWCATFLPPTGYVEAFCSHACAECYREWSQGRRPLEALAA